METLLTITFPVWLQLHFLGNRVLDGDSSTRWLWSSWIYSSGRQVHNFWRCYNNYDSLCKPQVCVPAEGGISLWAPIVSLSLFTSFEILFLAIITFWWFCPRIIFHFLITICNGSCDRMRIYLCNFLTLIHVLILAHHFFCSCSNASWSNASGSCKEYE